MNNDELENILEELCEVAAQIQKSGVQFNESLKTSSLQAELKGFEQTTSRFERAVRVLQQGISYRLILGWLMTAMLMTLALVLVHELYIEDLKSQEVELFKQEHRILRFERTLEPLLWANDQEWTLIRQMSDCLSTRATSTDTTSPSCMPKTPISQEKSSSGEGKKKSARKKRRSKSR